MKNIVSILIIPILIPLKFYKSVETNTYLKSNLILYVLGGLMVPFIGIKLIEVVITMFFKN
jgi:K+-transporting ATPase ATPase B chain